MYHENKRVRGRAQSVQAIGLSRWVRGVRGPPEGCKILELRARADGIKYRRQRVLPSHASSWWGIKEKKKKRKVREATKTRPEWNGEKKKNEHYNSVVQYNRKRVL